METSQPSKKKAKTCSINTDQPKTENNQELKIAQYNIWFDDFEMEKRTKAIGNIITTSTRSVHVIILERLRSKITSNNIKIATFQEVTERSLTTLRQTLREYNFFRQRNCKYFVTTIAHKSIPTRDKQFHPFTSTTMGRGMLTIKVQPFQQPSNQQQQWTPNWELSFGVANNGESKQQKQNRTVKTMQANHEDHSNVRRTNYGRFKLVKQTILTNPFLTIILTIILTTFNRKDPTKKNQHDGSAIDQEWKDTWTTINPDQKGYTYDGVMNGMLNNKIRTRADRILTNNIGKNIIINCDSSVKWVNVL